MLIAVTRAVSPTLAECELTHLPRDPINVADATAQHASYEAALRSLGATVVRAPDEPKLRHEARRVTIHPPRLDCVDPRPEKRVN